MPLLSRPLTKRLVAATVALAVLLSLPSLMLGFFCDDFIHLVALDGVDVGGARPFDLYRFATGDVARMHELVARGPWPWWCEPSIRAAFFRPIPSLLIGFDRWLFGLWAVGYHAHVVLWYGALVAAVGLLYRKVAPSKTALLALLFFAVDEAHASSVGWIASRYALVSAVFVTLSLHAYWRHRTERASGALPLSLLAYGVALGCGESALGLPCFLLAFELFTDEPVRRRARALAPFAALTFVYLVAHRMGGYGTSGSGVYTDPIAEPLRYVTAAPVRLVVLVGTLVTSLPADLWVLVDEVHAPLFGLAVVAVVAFGWLARASLRAAPTDERRVLARLGVGALLALIPSLGAPVGVRLLVLPSIGAMPVLAAVASRALEVRGLRGGGVWLLVANLLLPPLFFLGTFGGLRLRTVASDRVVATFARSQPKARLALVRATDPFVGIYGAAALPARHGLKPEVWNVFAQTSHPMRLTRVGERVFDVQVLQGQLLDGSFEQVWRIDRSIPVGYRVHTEAFDVEVLALEDGRPKRLQLTLNDAPDSGETAYLVQTNAGLVPLDFPSVGESVTLPEGPRSFDP